MEFKRKGIPLNLQLFASDSEVEKTEDSNADQEETKETEAKEEEKKYTDEEVNEIIKKKLAKWKKDQEKKTKEAEEYSKLNDDEKKDHTINALQEKLDEYEKKEEFSKMAKEVTKQLSEKDITLTEALVNMLVREDAESTKETVDDFIEEFNKSVAAAVKKALAGKTPGVTVTGTQKEDVNPYAKQRNEREKINHDIKSNWN